MPRVLECPPGSEYDEETFHYLLRVEQARAVRLGAPLRVLLAALEPTRGLPMPLREPAARCVFRGLRSAMRETDVVGWYRQGLVAGVVLNAAQEESDAEAFERRIETGMRRQLPEQLARIFRVHVVVAPTVPPNVRTP